MDRGRWAALVAVLLVGCSHHKDSPAAASGTATAPASGSAPAPAPAPVAPETKGPVTVVTLSDGFLVGAGDEGIYYASFDPSSGEIPLMRHPKSGGVAVLGKSVHGFVMTPDYVYWTDPGLSGPNTGGVWRAKRPAGDPEQLVSGSNLPEKLVVIGDRIVYWEGGLLLAVGKDGGTPSKLAVLDQVAFQIVADDHAVYWVGGTMEVHRLGAVTLDGAVKTIATFDGDADALATDGKQLFVGTESPKGVKVVSLAKDGGAMTTWADGAFDNRTLVVTGGGVALLDKDGHTVQRVASPGAAPEVLYRAPDGKLLAGLVEADGRLYVGQADAPAH